MTGVVGNTSSSLTFGETDSTLIVALRDATRDGRRAPSGYAWSLRWARPIACTGTRHASISSVFAAAFVAGVVLLVPAPAQAAFGISSFNVTATGEDGFADLQAGSHPFVYTIDFAANQDGDGEPEGTLRSLAVALPPGFVGNPLAVQRCRMADFEGQSAKCPGATQVGLVRAEVVGVGSVRTPLYNLVPPPGATAAFAFSAAGVSAVEQVSLRGLGGAGFIEVSAPVLPGEGIKSLEETIWGVPADHAHDPERTCIGPGGTFIEGCSAEAAAAPLLTLPTSCAGPLLSTITISSLEEPNSSVSASALSRDDEGNPLGMEGCSELELDPEIAVRPGTAIADSPTGLQVNLRLPLLEAAGQPAEANLRDATVRLPAGFAINPSAANGLLACSAAQFGLQSAVGAVPLAFTADPETCPDAAKIGTAEIDTPLLEEPLHGAIYLARQGENPFGSLLALYVAVENPLRGVIVKLAGRVEPDPRSGQLTVTFSENTQLPFEDIALDFFAGPRAIFTTPATCGTYTTTAELTPWSAPEGAVATRSDAFPIDAGSGGGACAPGEAALPNAPASELGTLTASAGSYSPLILKFKRENGSQRLGALSVTLPPGLTARLAGLRECSPERIAAAKARDVAGQGALEQKSPSCPPASELGSVLIGAGTGTPLHLAGQVYLGGPYRGAPLSLTIVVPAVAGPFDLGTVVVRAALRIDPRTAQLTVVTDPFPAIVAGIPLGVRSIAIALYRPGLIRNPTSCDSMTVRGEATSPSGGTATLSNRFQVGGCARLGFKPKASVGLLGPTGRGAHPRMRTVLTARPGDADIRRAALTLPGTELLDSRHIRAICTGPRFDAGRCPADSIYGYAKAWTPLLDRPLEGPIYLRSSNSRLPDLAVSLHGQIDLDLTAALDSVAGRLRTTIERVPDVPLTKVVLTMRGGRRGLLANTGGLCSGRLHAEAGFGAHNEKAHGSRPVVRTDCGA